MHPYVNGSIMYNSWDGEAASVSINKLLGKDGEYMYTMEYYSATRKNEILPFATRMDLEGYYAKWSKSRRNTSTVWFHLYVKSKQNKKSDAILWLISFSSEKNPPLIQGPDCLFFLIKKFIFMPHINPKSIFFQRERSKTIYFRTTWTHSTQTSSSWCAERNSQLYNQPFMLKMRIVKSEFNYQTKFALGRPPKLQEIGRLPTRVDGKRKGRVLNNMYNQPYNV